MGTTKICHIENRKGFVKVSAKPKIGCKLRVGAIVNSWSLMEAIATELPIPTSYHFLTLCQKFLEMQVRLTCHSQVRRELMKLTPLMEVWKKGKDVNEPSSHMSILFQHSLNIALACVHSLYSY